MDFALVISAIILAGCRKLHLSVLILAVQAFIIGIGLIDKGSLEPGFLTILVKGILVPVLLIKSTSGIGFKPRSGLLAPVKLQVFASVALVLVAYWATGAPGPLSESGIAPAVALVLVGVLVMVLRSKTVSQIVGLMVVENGIALASINLTDGLPHIVEFGVLFDVAIAAALMAFLTTRIGQEFGSLSTREMNDLRG